MTSSLKTIIAPSLLASDLSCASAETQRMLDAGCDWLHVDVMDGHFVPNLSVGPGIVKCLRKRHPTAFLDVHLMVSEPVKWVEPFASAGASSLTFHWEATSCAEEEAAAAARKVVAAIRSKGVRAGLALKPATSLNAAASLLSDIDMLLVMTVEPGFGGQKFMSDMLTKVKEARALFPQLDIQVDGGLDAETVEEAAKAGANVIVAGTSIFNAKDPSAYMQYMRDVVRLSLCS